MKAKFRQDHTPEKRWVINLKPEGMNETAVLKALINVLNRHGPLRAAAKPKGNTVDIVLVMGDL